MTSAPAFSRVFLRLIESDDLRSIVAMEARALAEEGFDVAAVQTSLARRNTREQLIRLYGELRQAETNERFGFTEPSALPEIHSARPPRPHATQVAIPLETLYDRIYGGWLGRVAGCVLGKPVEWGWSKEKVKAYLKLAESYPLTNYFPRLAPMPQGFEFNPGALACCLGELDGAPDDDDTDYTLLALHILETYGLDFTAADVTHEWLSHLAYLRTYTAERSTYRNLIAGVPPEAAASVLNPEREFIGARIRADLYGLIAPGRPELAATLAHRDASLSHTKNGIYSAMFMAAMLAWSFVTDDIEAIIRAGLGEIPENCRLAAAVRDVIDAWRATRDWEVDYEHLATKYQAYHPVHAINNTVWLVLALLYGRGDFEATICTAAMCGLDTDCNAANAGAVVGVLCGAQALPAKWTGPLHDTLYTSLAQWRETRISELARRTARIAGKALPQPS